MIDGALYTNTAGAKESLRTITIIANNLANMNTIGFHADFETLKSQNIKTNIAQTRIMPVADQTYTDFKEGPMIYTGRELDVAISGSGYLAVQTKDGTEAYTRAGNLEITPQGTLITNKGDLVLGMGGSINIPENAITTIDKDGSIFAQRVGEPAPSEIGKLKLVEIAHKDLMKNKNGLFEPIGDSSATVTGNVRIVPKSLEGSNVDPIRAMADLIECSRQFDMQTKVIKTVDDNAIKANQLLDIAS